jgi:hypothetical protein
MHIYILENDLVIKKYMRFVTRKTSGISFAGGD